MVEGCAVVVSPLISLMKAQVDALNGAGVGAAFLNSSLGFRDRRAVEERALGGGLRFLYLAPERLVQEDFLAVLDRMKVSFFAVDEAHCISHWGHDFRPEYRKLRMLKERFPEVPAHAFTATATPEVRADIVRELALRNPKVLVGNFDRPNLTYRALPRQGAVEQILRILGRHPGESGIIYSIRRSDTEDLCRALQARGIKALPYHAGLSQEIRKFNQDQFSKEEAEVIVATVAFGMGINRSNLRFVVHAGLPKSIEHYQQETGRAGRDGLPAECVLLHSGSDFMTWKFIMEAEGTANLSVELKKLSQMAEFARGGACRHRALVGYFGQDPGAGAPCGACDFCLGEVALLPDSTEVAKAIVSCVTRFNGRFGAGHAADVLRGNPTPKVQGYGHEEYPEYGRLKERSGRSIRIWTDQLIAQNLLEKAGGLYPTLGVTQEGAELLRGERQAALSVVVEPKREKKTPRASKSQETQDWEGVDRDLFESLRRLRRGISQELQVAAYVVFGDRTLREIARVKPRTLEEFGGIWGVGQKKCQTFGARFLACIHEHSELPQVRHSRPSTPLGINSGGNPDKSAFREPGPPPSRG